MTSIHKHSAETPNKKAMLCLSSHSLKLSQVFWLNCHTASKPVLISVRSSSSAAGALTCGFSGDKFSKRSRIYCSRDSCLFCTSIIAYCLFSTSYRLSIRASSSRFSCVLDSSCSCNNRFSCLTATDCDSTAPRPLGVCARITSLRLSSYATVVRRLPAGGDCAARRCCHC